MRRCRQDQGNRSRARHDDGAGPVMLVCPHLEPRRFVVPAPEGAWFLNQEFMHRGVIRFLRCESLPDAKGGWRRAVDY